MSFSVNIQLDADGARTVSINGLKPTDTIADLIQKLVDKEGLDQDMKVTLVFRAKQLSDTSKKLKDVGIKARSNLFAAFKVRGGMAHYDPTGTEGTQGGPAPSGSKDTTDVGDGSTTMRRFNQKEAAKYNIKVTNKNCGIYCSDGCGVSSVAKLTFTECNNDKHVYCADCMYTTLDRAICVSGRTYVQCALTCQVKFDLDAAFVAAALTDDEVAKFEKQLNKNCLTVICPNNKCKAYILIDGINTNKVQCCKCKGVWFCKLCKRDWPANNKDYMVCGYSDCNASAKIFDTLTNCDRKDYSGYGCVEKNVPSLRVCKKCHSYVEWVNACKHSTCQRCQYKFCFVCLKEGHGCSLGTACKVEEQKSLY